MDVIYLAGGHGKRVGLGYPKQFARINGKSIFLYGIETLCEIQKIENIIIPSKDYLFMSEQLESLNLKNYKTLINCRAGRTRQESVFYGLKKVTSDFVLIHESVRPFASKKLIMSVIDAPGDCVVPIDQSIATVIDINGLSYDRNIIGAVQTPQKYRTESLKIVHETTKLKNSTDDYSLIYDYMNNNNNIKDKRVVFDDVLIFHGEHTNIKITYPVDLQIAKGIYNYLYLCESNE